MSETITLTRTRQVTAVVNEVVDYEVQKEAYEELIEEGNSPEEALEILRSDGEAESTDYSTSVVEFLDQQSESVSVA